MTNNSKNAFDELSISPSINITKADPNLPPSQAKPAATVLLIRSEKSRIEVFMMLRNKSTNFGGAWVFPGGKLETHDDKIELHSISQGLTDEMASNILGMKEGGLNYWIACIRECFEESGVLLAYRKSGELFDRVSESEKNTLDYFRRELNLGKPVLLDLCRELEIKLAVDRLAYISHWITPKTELRRYSTRFFVGLAPTEQQAVHDGGESVKSIWINPEEAIKRGMDDDFQY